MAKKKEQIIQFEMLELPNVWVWDQQQQIIKKKSPITNC